MSKVIFLDVDGVLNGHEVMSNGYCGIKKECVDNFNVILKQVPEAQIVLTSAWRYLAFDGIANKGMGVNGLENLFLTHGLNCKGRFKDVTYSDEYVAVNFLNWSSMNPCRGEEWFNWVKENGVLIRQEQIRYFTYLNLRSYNSYVIIDDIDLKMDRQILTDGKVGLTTGDVDKAINLLKKKVTIKQLESLYTNVK